MIEDRYKELETKRQPYIDRAKQCAQFTIPSLFPQDDSNQDKLYVPYQGLGSRGLKNLANKLLLSLFPPNQPFFQLLLDEDEVEEGTEGDINEALSLVENEITQNLETLGLRNAGLEGIKQLLCSGNYLFYYGKEGIRGYRLDKYVLRRNGFGVMTELIIKEVIQKEDIPESIHELVRTTDKEFEDKKEYHQYTVVKLVKNMYHVHQEIEGHVIPKTTGKYRKDQCPYLALRMIPQDGEDYGRSFVEEHIGDLFSLEYLSKALLEGSQAAARIIFLLEPSSTLKAKTLEKAKNLDVLTGSKEDVSTLQLDKFADFRVAKEQIDDLTKELSAAFLMNSSVTRQAERVTAEEIRFLANELETGLGGVYSLLGNEWQLPSVKIGLGRLVKARKLPEGIEKLRPKVITGVQALGRTQEIEKIRLMMSLLADLGPQVLSENIEVDELVKRVASAVYLDTNGLVPTKEQKEQRRREALLSQLGQNVAPDMAKELLGQPQSNET